MSTPARHLLKHRLAGILPVYVAVHAVCYFTAFSLRFDFAIPAEYRSVFWLSLPAVLGIKSLGCVLMGEWKRSFRYASVVDMVALTATTLCTTAALLLLNRLFLSASPVPRSVLLIDAALSQLALGLIRVSLRTFAEVLQPAWSRHETKPALIYGVQKGSIGILRMLNATATEQSHDYKVVGFVDFRDVQQNSLIAGVRIYSEHSGWKSIVEQTGAAHLLIPGGVPGRVVRSVLHECASAGLQVHVIPAVDELVEGRFKLAIRDLTVSDLLRREPNRLDMASIRQYVAGRRVLVTGGAGSIGSELCRQIRDLRPESLLIVDQSESAVFELEQEFSAATSVQVACQYAIASIRDEVALDRLLTEHRPDIIFHAAAYKHVPLMEDNPQAAVLNNVIGTKTLIDLAERHGVDRFVMISTDKAVRPTSVMGATKLMAEKYLQSIAATSQTRFMVVRFGNVLNSVGSVVPTFRRQIEQGGPVTVTHPEMTRFFMTIPEAVQLVLQAGAIGNSGEVLILDMGEPVRIVDLAKDLILLSGLRYPGDIDIVFTGLRPGEKLHEELFYSSESGAIKVHEKIYSGSPEMAAPLVAILSDLERLEDAAHSSKQETLAVLQQVVNSHTDAPWVPARLGVAA